MNGAHLHLTVNEVPILGTFAGAVLLTVALVARSREVWARAGLIALATAAVGALVAFLSGIGAADVVAGAARTSNAALEQHHLRATVASSLVGLAAIVGAIVFIRARGRRFTRPGIAVVLAVAILAAAALAWTGLAGGRINHPELQQPGDLEEGPAHHH